LVLKEVEKLLRENRAVGDKEISEYMEVLGYADAANWIYKQALTPDSSEAVDIISVTEIRHIHYLAMKKVWEVAPHPDAFDSEAPGSYRQHEIMPFADGMQPPTFPLIAAELNSWIDEANAFANRLKKNQTQLEQVPNELAKLHRRFEWIHPFLDGNGRTGRLVLNLLLIRLGWPPAVIFKAQRKKYLAALNRADNGDFDPLGEMIARCVIDSLYRLIPSIAGPVKFVPIETLADKELSVIALRRAAQRGRLEAIQDERGRYRTSRLAVDEYKRSRRHQGRQQ